MRSSRFQGGSAAGRILEYTAAVTAIVGALWCGFAVAYPNEPNGWGKAKFNMTLGEVMAAYPEMKLIGQATKIDISGYKIENQTVIGLKPCAVTFRFASNAFYEVDFDCGRGDNVLKALNKTFGEPSATKSSGIFWTGDKTVIVASPKNMTFGYTDRARGDQVQRALMAAVLAGGAPPSAPAAQAETPTPAANP